MTTSDNGSGATPMAPASRTLDQDETRFMLAALPGATKVYLVSQFGSTEKSFSDLTHDQQRSLLDLLGITGTVTRLTIAAPTSDGALSARTTETVAAVHDAKAVDWTPKPFPTLSELATRIKNGEVGPDWTPEDQAMAERLAPRQVVAEPPSRKVPDSIEELHPGMIIWTDGGTQKLTINNIYRRERTLTAYNEDGVRQEVPFDAVNFYEDDA